MKIKKRGLIMLEVLVVYYSRTGNTEEMAKAIGDGLGNVGVDVKVKKVEETTLEDLQRADGVVLGAPTYFGSMPSVMKEFVDRSIEVRGKLEGKVGAAFTSSKIITGGNETTLISMIEAMLCHGMVIIGDPIKTGGHYGVVSIGNPDDETLKACREFGGRVGELVKKLG
jgi:NAD(P)H dehydrogenase (quinone)